MPDDRFAKFDYSKLISWDQRLQREWPLLEEILGNAPSRKILDLGSGTGEHARFLASKGFEVTGIDASPGMIERSRASTGTEHVHFILGDMRDVAATVDGEFGAALCLGNALPHLREDDDLRRLSSGLRRVLSPGAPFVVQIINYDRIEAKHERALPLTFLPDPDDALATIIFMRAMELRPDGKVIFMPTTLRLRADREVPIELVTSQRVEIRGWRAREIESVLHQSGFASIELWGSYQKAPFDPAESRDVIAVAR